MGDWSVVAFVKFRYHFSTSFVYMLWIYASFFIKLVGSLRCLHMSGKLSHIYSHICILLTRRWLCKMATYSCLFRKVSRAYKDNILLSLKPNILNMKASLIHYIYIAANNLPGFEVSSFTCLLVTHITAVLWPEYGMNLIQRKPTRSPQDNWLLWYHSICCVIDDTRKGTCSWSFKHSDQPLLPHVAQDLYLAWPRICLYGTRDRSSCSGLENNISCFEFH